MTATPSTMLELGTQAPHFSLPSTTGATVSLTDYPDAKGYLIIFMCNHCPYVKHIRAELARIGKDYIPKGLAMFGISSNDAENYPDDSFEKMKEEIAIAGYTFPYLYDESQSVAKAYRAACTPDIFLFDGDAKLIYRGQFDESRPSNGKPVTGKDLRDAIKAVISGNPVSKTQIPSLGCNIKWKAGNEPNYFENIKK